MQYQLSQPALQRAKALVSAGKVNAQPWGFTADDSNALLGLNADNPGAGNWVEYAFWFIGRLQGKGDPVTNTSVTPDKTWYAYPFGKAGTVSLTALEQIITDATANGDGDIAAAVTDLLKQANANTADKVQTAPVPPPATPAMFASTDKNDRNALTLTTTLHIHAASDTDGTIPNPTFDMQAYNGGPMRLKGWSHPVVVDLDGVDTGDKSRPVLRDHDHGTELGHTTSISTDNGKLTASGVISGHGPHVDRVVQSAKNGFPWQASIGAKVIANQFVEKGKTANANGQTFEGPINIARRTSLGEISFVALGADDSTTARIAAKTAEGTPMKFKAWMKARGFTAADMDAEQTAAAKKMYAAMVKDGDPDDDSEDDDDDDKKKKDADAADKKKKADAAAAAADITASRDDDQPLDAKAIAAQVIKESRELILAERKRTNAIAATLDKYRTRVDANDFATIEASAISEGWDDDKLELNLLRKARQPGPVITASGFGINTGKGSEATPEIVAAACALNGGVGEKYAMAGMTEQQKNVASSQKVRKNLGSIYGMCAVVAASHGKSLPSTRMDEDVIRAMFTIERQMQIQADGGGAGGYSTMSLGGLTENILNKAMLEAYGNVPSVVPQVAWETDTNDFKTFKRYRLTAAGVFQALGPAGELKSMSLQDESYPNQLKTNGIILNVGRDIILNDDMGALTQAPTLLGRGAALYRERVIFLTLAQLAGTAAPGASIGQQAKPFTFFSTGAANYMAGAGSALSLTSLQAAMQKFREQKDSNGDPVMLQPDRLIVSPALEVTAYNLFNGENLVASALSASAGVLNPNVNAFKGKFTPIVSPYLGANSPLNKAPYNAGLTDTSWILTTNPSGGFAPIQIGYLRGQRTPVIERGEANFNTLGMSMRSYWDIGVAPHDYRTAVLSLGA